MNVRRQQIDDAVAQPAGIASAADNARVEQSPTFVRDQPVRSMQ